MKGLLKMTPAILTANGILLTANWTIGNPWNDQIDAARVALATFLTFSWLLAFAVLFDESIESVYTKHQRNAAIQNSEVSAHRTVANEYFKQFCKEYMAGIGHTDIKPDKLSADGTVNEFALRRNRLSIRIKCHEWLPQITFKY